MSDSLSNYVRKRKIANKSTWTSVVVNFFLVIFQIVVGFFSKSSGLIADGFHTLADMSPKPQNPYIWFWLFNLIWNNVYTPCSGNSPSGASRRGRPPLKRFMATRSQAHPLRISCTSFLTIDEDFKTLVVYRWNDKLFFDRKVSMTVIRVEDENRRN